MQCVLFMYLVARIAHLEEILVEYHSLSVRMKIIQRSPYTNNHEGHGKCYHKSVRNTIEISNSHRLLINHGIETFPLMTTRHRTETDTDKDVQPEGSIDEHSEVKAPYSLLHTSDSRRGRRSRPQTEVPCAGGADVLLSSGFMAGNSNTSCEPTKEKKLVYTQTMDRRRRPLLQVVTLVDTEQGICAPDNNILSPHPTVV